MAATEWPSTLWAAEPQGPGLGSMIVTWAFLDLLHEVCLPMMMT